MPGVTERSGDGTITVSPRQESDQSALVVICHGLGDTAEGFVDVAEHLSKSMPHVKFILPTAPTQRVTLNMGMAMPSWYDIVGLDERSNEKCTGIQESRKRVADILQTEHEETKLPYRRMLLAGFSQGGALSLFTGLQLPEKLAGIVGLSSYVPSVASLEVTPGLEETPILMCHGTQDVVVQYSMAEKSKQHLLNKGIKNLTLKTYPIGHTVSPAELVDVQEFLHQCLPPDDTCKVQLKDPSEMSIKELKAAIRKNGLSHKAVGLMEKHEFVRMLQDHRDGKL